MTVSTTVNLKRLLDLSDPRKVKEILSIDIQAIRIRTGIRKSSKAYSLTQKIDKITKKRSYKSVVFKSAHTDIGKNIVIFSDKVGVDLF